MPALPAGVEMLHLGRCPRPGVLDTPLVPPVASTGPIEPLSGPSLLELLEVEDA